MCSGAVHNMTQLIVTRIFLGIFEATFGAGAPFFLSCLYKRRELGLRMSILLGMSPLANTFASSLAYGITHIKGSLAPWRLLFIIGKIIPSINGRTDLRQRAHRPSPSLPWSTSSSSTPPQPPSFSLKRKDISPFSAYKVPMEPRRASTGDKSSPEYSTTRITSTPLFTSAATFRLQLCPTSFPR